MYFLQQVTPDLPFAFSSQLLKSSLYRWSCPWFRAHPHCCFLLLCSWKVLPSSSAIECEFLHLKMASLMLMLMMPRVGPQNSPKDNVDFAWKGLFLLMFKSFLFPSVSCITSSGWTDIYRGLGHDSFPPNGAPHLVNWFSGKAVLSFLKL